MINSETNFISKSGNVQYSIKYSEKDGYIEIVESRLDSRKKVQTVRIDKNIITAEEMELFCQTIEAARNCIFPEFIEEVIDEDYE